jgi:hypothetical protein
MSFKPNFDNVFEIVGTDVVVKGHSDPDPAEFSDILNIRVVLVQENTTDGGNVDLEKNRRDLQAPDPDWSVNVAVGSFKPGPAVAFGVETRRTNFLTMTWTEPVTIKK